ncbi:hypothetical protein TanjilG_30551 [Lupinus angustifolius]|uniref:Uncharacterized protein n=2 Tax=Lupinus angustifolius TaxID=3871 RepID=A0A1J7GNX6_LUPAN|nr:hypothetical protein TanjilG_30551 [Lupinus angustifolius]
MKDLSVAIAEASSIEVGAEMGQQEIQPQPPRKRGRPRKIIVMETNQEKKIEAAEKATENSMKKEEQPQQQQEESIAACMSINNTKEKEFQLIITKGEPSRRSRVRRKSKPRKST